jgi:putative membrane protein
MTDWLLASGHHIALLLMVSVLGAEAVLMRQPPSGDVIRILSRVDALYGISAGALLVLGLMRLSMGTKGFAFYSSNWVFWAKMALFAAIGLISILPTVRFIRWRRAHEATGTMHQYGRRPAR